MSSFCDECKRTRYNDHLTGIIKVGEKTYCPECVKRKYNEEVL